MQKEIKEDALVSWKEQGKTVYGRVIKVNNKYAWVSLCENKHWGEKRKIAIEKLTYVPPVILSVDLLRKFARFEIPYHELVKENPKADIEVPVPYQMGPEDLEEAVQNYLRSGISEDDFAAEYFWPIWEDGLYFDVDMETALNGPDEDTEETKQVPNRYTVFSTAWHLLVELFEYDNKKINIGNVITEIQTWEDNKDKPLLEREYTDAQKRDFLEFWNDDRIANASTEMKEHYRRVVDSMCAENDAEALRIKAYACYGNGNAVYGQDWNASMDCLLRLMEVKSDSQIANTLGYMYYYGRCNNGVPEYDKAFYYFSIGAAGGYYESRYKLSDMFRHGYGVAKNPRASAVLIWELYDEQIKKIRKGKFESDFADVALRAGNIWKDGIDCYPDPDRAYYYYLQAQYAIRMRMLNMNCYGDQKVAAGIEQAIEEILPKTSYGKPKRIVHAWSAYFFLQNGVGRKHHMEMKIRRVSDSEVKLTFRIVPFNGEKHAPKVFITLPEAHFCGLLDKVRITVKRVYKFKVSGESDTILFDTIEGTDFCLYGKTVATISGDYIITAPSMQQKKVAFASVTFSPGGKRYDYRCEIPVQSGDKVIVKVKDEEKEVTVVDVYMKSESELALPLKDYKLVLRKVDK